MNNLQVEFSDDEEDDFDQLPQHNAGVHGLNHVEEEEENLDDDEPDPEGHHLGDDGVAPIDLVRFLIPFDSLPFAPNFSSKLPIVRPPVPPPQVEVAAVPPPEVEVVPPPQVEVAVPPLQVEVAVPPPQVDVAAVPQSGVEVPVPPPQVEVAVVPPPGVQVAAVPPPQVEVAVAVPPPIASIFTRRLHQILTDSLKDPNVAEVITWVAGDNYCFEIKDIVQLSQVYFDFAEMNTFGDECISNGFVAHSDTVWRHRSDNFCKGRPDLLEEIPALATYEGGASCADEKGK